MDTVQTCWKNLASVSGTVIAVTGVAPVEQTVPVVFCLKQTSCFKNAPVAVASAVVTEWSFVLAVPLGTTKIVDVRASVFVPVPVEFVVIFAFKPIV